MSEYIVQLISVVKRFEIHNVVDGISLGVRKGEFLTLLGPSGCGKTTTLRMVAGFEKPTEGQILIEGRHVENREPYERDVNMVFQNYALFPHMNVFDNIAFGLRMKKTPKDIIKQKVYEALRLVQLEGYDKRMPDQLSGGQRQRVAIARALVNNPKVLLLDEPLGALDLKLRKQMQVELKHMQRKLGITFMYVTHDQEEALTMSDRIAVMNEGKLEQVGTPDEIYERPKSRFVVDFIGESNLFEAKVIRTNHDVSFLDIGCGEVSVHQGGLQPGENVYMAIRPERFRLTDQVNDNKGLFLKCFFKERIYVGSVIKTAVVLQNGKEVIISEPAGQAYDFDGNKDVFLTWDPRCAVVVKT